MDLDLTEEQEMLRNLVRSMCNDLVPLTVVRELEDDEVGFSPEFWKQLAELDLIGLLLPEAYGGSGMSMVEGALVYGELGRSLAPSPHFVSAVMGGGAIVRGGSEAQRQAWLPRIASGETIASIAWLEPENGYWPKGVQMRATPDGDGFVLAGVKRHVAFAEAADLLVVLARTGDGAEDVDLFLVNGTAPGLSYEQQKSVASDTQYQLTFDGVRVTEADRLGAPGSGWGTWHDTMLDGAILQAGAAVGGAQMALEITVQYAKDRVQFDKPLGAFQAIAHYLADAKTAVDGAEVLVWEAAWARANGRDAEKLAPMAKLFAGQTFRDVTAMAQQVHGGIGFTLEADIQLFFRRAKAWQLSWWDGRTCEELIARAVLDTP